MVPKHGDKAMVRSFAIDFMSAAKDAQDEIDKGNELPPIDVADFLWHEVWPFSLQKRGHFILAPYIQRVIDRYCTMPILKTVEHTEWIPKKGSFLAPGGPRPSVVAASTSGTSRKSKPMAEPLRRIAHFLGKYQKAIFDVCRSNATHVHQMEARRISQANALRARLRARPGSPVSGDEEIPPTTQVPDYGFPTAAEYAEFFTDVVEDHDEEE